MCKRMKIPGLLMFLRHPLSLNLRFTKVAESQFSQPLERDYFHALLLPQEDPQ